MARKEWLYGLVAADVVLAFATIGVESVMHKFLPPALREQQSRSWLESDWSVLALSELGLWVTSVALFVAAWIALVLFLRRAREIYLAAWALTALSLALRGPAVWTAAGTVLDTIGTLVSGALVGLVWFSDLAARYEERGAPDPEAASSARA